MDVAQLGFEIKTDSVKQAATDLDNMTAASARAGSGADTVAQRAQAAADSIAKINATALSAASGYDTLSGSATAASGAFAKMDTEAAMAAGAVNGYGESLDAVTARIRAMVAASTAQVASNAEVTLSERALREQAGLRVEATAAQIAATRAQVAAQDAQMAALAGITAGEERVAVATAEATVVQEANTAAHVNSRVAYETQIALSEVLSGNFGRLKRTLAALANASGLTAAALTGIGAVISGTVAVVGLLTFAWYESEKKTNDFNKALAATGDFAGTSSTGLREMAANVGSATGQYGNASTALLDLAKSGKVAAGSFEEIATGAVNFAYVTGESIQKAVEEFAKLGENPVQAAAKLNETYHFLTEAVYEQISAEQRNGETAAASETAQKALAEAFNQRAAEVREQLPPLIAWWQNLGEAAQQAWHDMGNVGSTDTSAKMASLLHEITTAMDNAADDHRGGNIKSKWDEKVAALEKQYTALQRVADVQKAVNNAVDDSFAGVQKQNDLAIADAADANKQAEAMTNAAEGYKHTHVQKEQAIIDNKLLNETEGLTGAAFDAVARRLNEQYAPALAKAAEADANVRESHKKVADATKDVVTAQERAFNSMRALDELAEKLGGKVAGPFQKAWADYAKNLDSVVAKSFSAASAQEKLLEATGSISKVAGEANTKTLSLAQMQAQAAISAGHWADAENIMVAAIMKLNLPLAQQEAILAKLRASFASSDAERVKTIAHDKAQADGLFGLTDKYVKAIDRASAMTDMQRAEAQATDEGTAAWLRKKDALEANGQTEDSVRAQLVDMAKLEVAMKDAFGSVQEDPFAKMITSLSTLKEALAKAKDGFVEFGNRKVEVEKVQAAIDQVNAHLAIGLMGAAATAIQGLESFAKQGSKEMAVMQLAVEGLGMAQAIVAVLTQGEGEPYSAWARMAAMAAAVAPFVAQLGGTISSFGGGGSSGDAAKNQQAIQGTGTVLGDAKAQSDSIAKATAITANASQQLVGLNRGMLTALQALHNALGAAGTSLANGAGNAQFAPTQDHTINLAGPGSSDPIGGVLGTFLFGGEQSIVDQGIVIFGGALKDMLKKVTVGAYQTVSTSGGLFGSDSSQDNINSASSALNKQFQLVLGSIVDTVREAAKALGIPLADIQAKIDAFKIAETKISLKGLSAADQQKAIQAVFSSIFDGLAGSVVPFIAQFQQVGEGLGETLVRVASEVQVAHEAFSQLGLAVSETNPEKFAQISDALVKATGGLDAFIAGLQSFVDKFAPQGQKLQIATDALNSAFSQVGLTVPQTRDGMWKLMQSLDATTVAGRAQIATILRLSSVEDQYYTALENEAKAKLAYSQFIDKFKPPNIGKAFEEQLQANIDQANALAKAAGMEGASMQDLLAIHQQAVQQLETDAQSLAFSLGLTTQGSLSEVNAEIARLQGLSKSASSSVSSFGASMTSVSQAATNAMNLLLGNLSPLNDAQKLQIALQGQRAGSVSPSQVLQIGRALYASSQAYNLLFAQVQAIGDHTQQASGMSGSGSASSTGTFTSADQARLTALLAERDMLQKSQTLGQYQTLAQQIAEIAKQKGETFGQVIKEMGVDQAALEKGLGIKSDKDLATYIANIQAQTSSSHDDTMSVVNELRLILDAIRNPPKPIVLPTGHSTHGKTAQDGTSSAPSVGDGSRGHNNRALSDGDVQAIGVAVARAVLGNTRNIERGVVTR